MKKCATIDFVLFVLIVFIVFALVGCGQPADEPGVDGPASEETHGAADSAANGEGPTFLPTTETYYGNVEGFAERYGMANWAWALCDWQADELTDTFVAAEYSAGAKFEELTIAVGMPGIIPVEYAGEKKGADDFSWPDFSPTYEVISGPSWKTTENLIPREASDYVLLPASCQDSLLSLAYLYAPYNPDRDPETEFYNYGRPPAEPGDIAIMEELRNGRRVAHSEQLALSSDGGRISLFQYETTHFGLAVIAYINGDKVIPAEFISPVYDDGYAQWASELPKEAFPNVHVSMLMQSDAGLVIGFSMSCLEWTSRHLLAEREGCFLEFNVGCSRYDIWADPMAYVQEEGGIIDSETWPGLVLEDLIGDWPEPGDSLYSFNVDGTGEKRVGLLRWIPITYYIDENLLFIYIDDPLSDYAYEDIYRAKVEGTRLIMQDFYNNPSQCEIITKK